MTALLRNHAALVLTLLLGSAAAVPNAAAKDKRMKEGELPARVIAHIPLPEAPGSKAYLQKQAGKQYLYIQQGSTQNYTIVDVTKGADPTVLKRVAQLEEAAGRIDIVTPDVALAESPEARSGATDSKPAPVVGRPPTTQTVKVLDTSDPGNPRTLQTFTGVTSILPDEPRALIFITNNEGLYVLRHDLVRMKEKKKEPCGSSDAIAAAPPECQ